MEKWSSHLAFIFASIGSAIGLGNIWRFSYTMGKNGGGTFLILYLLSVILIGLPLLILMLSVGKYFRTTITPMFKKMLKKPKLSWIHHFFNIVVLSYYTVVASWVLIFLVNSLFLNVPSFDHVLNSNLPFLFTLLIFALAYFVIKVNIRKGLEKINNYGMPIFFLILLFLAFYSLTLPGVFDAIRYMLSFNDFHWNILTLVVAQTLFSLSVGYGGIMLTYGSYLDVNENVPKSSAVIAFSDTFVSLLAAFVIFSISFTFSIPPSAGPSLAFETIPNVFSQLPLGNVLMILFFSLLFIAAFTSILSMLEVEVSDLSHIYKEDRQRVALYLVLFLMFLSLPSALSYSKFNFSIFGMKFLDFLDEVIVGRLAPIGALITLIAITWFWKDYKKIKINKILSFYLKYILPIILGISSLLNLFN